MIRTRSQTKKIEAAKLPSLKAKAYEYTPLTECLPGDADRTYNVFGVVLDASYPHKTKTGDHYVCTLKIAESAKSPVFTLVLFGSKFEEMPVIQRIGDIIRVHRVTVSEYNECKQFTSRLYFNSSWALFADKAQDFKPAKFFGKSFSPVDRDQQGIIKAMRKLRQNVGHSTCMISLSDISGLYESGKQDNTFDFIAKVESLDRVDEDHSEIVFSDDSTEEQYKSTIFTRKYLHLREGQTVKVKGASCYGQKEGSLALTLPFHANIMVQAEPAKKKAA